VTAICLEADHALVRAVAERADLSTLGQAQGSEPRRLLARALARWREWRRRSRDRAKLASFDDRMLSDIGLTRAEAEFLSRKPFWRE
jgi:uncharacterized protein YjiS (DUF1127 family)